MSVEVVASIIAGLIVGKSLALLAFAGDSVIELISAYAVLDYLGKLNTGIISGETDSEKTEKFATLLLVLLIPIIAGGAIYSYFSRIKLEASPLGIAVALGACIIMPILWIQKKRIGRVGNILSLSIDAAESGTCFFMSVAVLGSLLANYFFQISWADYVATAIILGFVVLEIRESLEEMRTPEL
ncbi:MAG: cation transporter [Nitrososphaerales archaeon]